MSITERDLGTYLLLQWQLHSADYVLKSVLFLSLLLFMQEDETITVFTKLRCYLVTGKCTRDCGGRSEVNIMSIEILLRIFEVTTAKT